MAGMAAGLAGLGGMPAGVEQPNQDLEPVRIPAPVGEFYCVPYMALLMTDFRRDCFRLKDANDVLQFQLAGDPRKRNHTQRILRNGAGNALLFLQRKPKSLHYKWNVYRGDEAIDHFFLFHVKVRTGFHKREQFHVYLEGNKDKKAADFILEGDFKKHSYSITHRDVIVAQVITNDAETVMFEENEYGVKLFPGSDHAFVVALVAIVEQYNVDYILPKLTKSWSTAKPADPSPSPRTWPAGRPADPSPSPRTWPTGGPADAGPSPKPQPTAGPAEAGTSE